MTVAAKIRNAIVAFILGGVCSVALLQLALGNQQGYREDTQTKRVAAVFGRPTRSRIGNLMITSTPYWSVQKQGDLVIAKNKKGMGEIIFGPSMEEVKSDEYYKTFMPYKSIIYEQVQPDIDVFYVLQNINNKNAVKFEAIVVNDNLYTKVRGIMKNDFQSLKLGFAIILGIREVV